MHHRLLDFLSSVTVFSGRLFERIFVWLWLCRWGQQGVPLLPSSCGNCRRRDLGCKVLWVPLHLGFPSSIHMCMRIPSLSFPWFPTLPLAQPFIGTQAIQNATYMCRQFNTPIHPVAYPVISILWLNWPNNFGWKMAVVMGLSCLGYSSWRPLFLSENPHLQTSHFPDSPLVEEP